MIHDKLQFLDNYLPKAGIPAVKEFLKQLSPEIENGHYPLLGEQIFVNVMDYGTKEPAQARIEAHDRYVDIQITLSGCEGISVFDRTSLAEESPYDQTNDVVFFQAGNAVTQAYAVNSPGYFTLLFPWDAHRPQERSGEETWVKKFVIKMEAA